MTFKKSINDAVPSERRMFSPCHGNPYVSIFRGLDAHAW